MTKIVNSISVKNGEIAGYHSGASAPKGNIVVTQAQLAEIKALQADGLKRNVRPLWSDGSASLPVDTRPIVEVKVNDSLDDAVIFIDTPFEVSMASAHIPDGRIIVTVFGRLFAMEFKSGSATKTVTNHQSGEFEFRSNSEFRSNNLKLRIVE